MRCDLFPSKRILSTFFLTVSLDFWVRWPNQYPISSETSYSTARVCTVFLHPAWLPSVPFRKESDGCCHGTSSLIFRLPFSRASCCSAAPMSSCPCHPGQVPCCHIVERGALRPGWGHTAWGRGRLGAPDNVQELCLGIKDITCSPFPNIFLLFENTQSKCYPMGLVALFSEPKSRCISHQANACLLCREDHPLPTMQKGADTSTGGPAPWPTYDHR